MISVHPRSARRLICRGLVAVSCALALLGGPASARATAETTDGDSTAVSTATSADTLATAPIAFADTLATAPPRTMTTLRGTDRPLERRASLVQKAGRAVLLVPYAAVTAVAWPATRLAYVEERYHPLGALASLLSFQRRREGVTLRGSFGYESSTGIAVVGGSILAEDWMGTGAALKLNGGYLDRDRNQAEITVRTPAALLSGELLARYDNREERPFYGLGPRSEEFDGEYNRERRFVEGTLRVRPLAWMSAEVAGYTRGTDLTPTGSDECITDLFPEDYALARDARYRGAEAMLTLDRRDRGALSTRGGLLRLVGGINESQTSADADYRHYAAEAQAFLNLYHGDRILALRAYAEGIDADHPERVPFTELPALGGKHGLRGYSRYRFTGEKALLLTAEYRYPVTTLFGGRLLFEWGSVASEWGDLRLADVDPVVGLALVANIPHWPLTAQLSRGSEGLELYVGTESVFGFESRRLR